MEAGQLSCGIQEYHYILCPGGARADPPQGDPEHQRYITHCHDHGTHGGLAFQSTLADMLAGLTIHLEKPLKQGDWILAGGTESLSHLLSERQAGLDAERERLDAAALERRKKDVKTRLLTKMMNFFGLMK